MASKTENEAESKLAGVYVVKFTTPFAVAGALLAGVSLFNTSSAAPLPLFTDDYDGTYIGSSVNSGGNDHVLWLPGLVDTNDGGDHLIDPHFQFVANSGVFWTVGDQPGGPDARLTGTVVNNGRSANTATIQLDFTWESKGPAAINPTPKCEFGVNVCGNGSNIPVAPDYLLRSNEFEYFKLTSGSLTGTGGQLANFGLVFSQLPSNGSKPMQLGFGANNKPGGTNLVNLAIADFGLSVWFSVVVNQANNDLQQQSFLDFNEGTTLSQRGDINLILTPVPIPAALPLLLTGLAGLGLLESDSKLYV